MGRYSGLLPIDYDWTALGWGIAEYFPQGYTNLLRLEKICTAHPDLAIKREFRLVDGLKALDRYAYCGHPSILGNLERPWQDSGYVLKRFSDKAASARKGYRAFVEKGIGEGRRKDLIGGGLIRSAGGWQAVKAMRRSGEHQKSDERILGDSDFVAETLARAKERMDRRSQRQASGYDLDALARDIGRITGVKPSEFLCPGKSRSQVRARSLFCFRAVDEMGCSVTELARRIGITPAAVSLSVQRGRAHLPTL